MKKFIVLIGNYGSGKTEIAINLAVNSAAKGLNTLVVDLDKVNDYFRMSDRVELLKENHVNLVSPTFAGQGVTPSNMSAAVASAFAGDWDLCIFDVGGDAAGGKAGTKSGFAHQQHTVGQPPGGQHLLHAGFQFCVAFHAVQHHDGRTPFMRQ